jgi:hypothetical protein
MCQCPCHFTFFGFCLFQLFCFPFTRMLVFVSLPMCRFVFACKCVRVRLPM